MAFNYYESGVRACYTRGLISRTTARDIYFTGLLMDLSLVLVFFKLSAGPLSPSPYILDEK